MNGDSNSSGMIFVKVNSLIDFVNHKKNEFEKIFDYLRNETYSNVQKVYFGGAAEDWLSSLNTISEDTLELLNSLLSSISDNFADEIKNYKEMEDKLKYLQSDFHKN